MAPYTLEPSQTTIDRLNKHFPAIYIYNCQKRSGGSESGGNVGKWVQASLGDGKVEG